MTDRIASAPQANRIKSTPEALHCLRGVIAELNRSGPHSLERPDPPTKKARAAKITRARDIRAQDRRAIGLHPVPHPRATLAAASAFGLIAAAICAHLAGVF